MQLPKQDTDLIGISDVEYSPNLVSNDLFIRIITLVSGDSFIGLVPSNSYTLSVLEVLLPAHFEKKVISKDSELVSKFNPPFCIIPYAQVKTVLPIFSYFEYYYIRYVLSNKDILPEFLKCKLDWLDERLQDLGVPNELKDAFNVPD